MNRKLYRDWLDLAFLEKGHGKRRGWMLLESTVAVIILLAGSVAAVRLAFSQHAYRAASRQSLAEDIACENVASWLRSSNTGSLPADIETVETLPFAEGLRLKTSPFQSGEFSGVKVSISPATTAPTPIERNLWILTPPDDALPSVDQGVDDAS
jgi:type II secretory pathway pseudopilin PulG